MKKFSIPVTWEVWDKVEIEAETIEKALAIFEATKDEIPLGTDPEYIDGTYRIDDGENGQADVKNTVKYLKEFWDLSGGITGEEIDDLENDIPYVNRYTEMIDRHHTEREAFPHIIAIGNQALEDGLLQNGWSKEDVLLVHDCGILGCYVHKDDYKNFTDMIANQKQEYAENISDGIKGEVFISEMFSYALLHCEYFAFEDLQSILEFLNIDREDFDNNPALNSGFEYAKNLYMSVYNGRNFENNCEDNHFDEEMER